MDFKRCSLNNIAEQAANGIIFCKVNKYSENSGHRKFKKASPEVFQFPRRKANEFSINSLPAS